MEQSDKLFKAFLRMLIARIKSATEEKDPERAKEQMRELLADLQTTLED